jgi:hypothetical protein
VVETPFKLNEVFFGLADQYPEGVQHRSCVLVVSSKTLREGVTGLLVSL